MDPTSPHPLWMCAANPMTTHEHAMTQPIKRVLVACGKRLFVLLAMQCFYILACMLCCPCCVVHGAHPFHHALKAFVRKESDGRVLRSNDSRSSAHGRAITPATGRPVCRACPMSQLVWAAIWTANPSCPKWSASVVTQMLSLHVYAHTHTAKLWGGIDMLCCHHLRQHRAA